MTLDVSEARKWLDLCGSCDGMLPMSCTCPEGDIRSVLAVALAEVEALRAGLKLIGTECSNFTRGTCADPGSGRTPDAKCGADRWCDECIARVALAGGESA